MKEMWEARYAASEYVYGTSPNIWFKQCLDNQIAGKILMAAEGEGRNAVYAAQNRWEVSAFDLAESGRKKALTLASKAGVDLDFRTADALTVNYPLNHFDALGILFFHLPAEIRGAVFSRLSSFVKPGGHIILECFSKKHFGNTQSGPKSIDLLYDPEELRNDFQGFTMIEFEEF